MRATDEPTMLHDVCRAIVTEGGYRLVWVGYVEHDARKSVRPAANFGYEHGYLETVDISWADVPQGRGPTGTAIRQRRPVVCRDMLKDPNYLPWRDEARRRGYASSIVLPLLSDGDAIGALNIYATEPDAFDENETKLLAELADDLAFGIRALRTRRARDEAEAEARRNAALLRQTEAISHVGGWEYDVPGNQLVWSDETYRIHDLAPGGDECTVERALGFYSDESRPRLAEALARAIGHGESYDLELPLVTAKGRRIWVRTVGRAESRDGKVVRVFGNIVDITERVRSFAALQAERQRFIDVLNMMPAYVVLLTPDYHVPFANRFFEQRFGRAQGRRCYEYLFNLSELCKVCRTFDVLKTKAPLQWEWLGPDGRNYDIHDFPFTDTDGSTLIMEVGLDVTDIRKAREELSRAGAYNRSLIEASIDPLVTIGSDGRITDVNAATEGATGLARANLIGTDFCDYFTDPAQARAGYQQVFRDGLVRDYPLELRHRDGRITSVLYNASVYHDEQGKVIGVFAAARDITERKRTGEALRRSEASLKEAQRLAHIGNWELDLVHNVLTWSDEIYRIFELDPAGFGASYEAFLDAIHPDDRDAVNRAYTHSLENRTPYAIVHRMRMKDGRIKHVQERCETTYDDAGKPLRSFGTVQDVTERQLAEEHIRQLNVGLEKRVTDRTQELTAERATLEAIFDSVNVGMLLIDRHGTVKRLNRFATRWTSRSAPAADRTQCGDVLGCIHSRETPAGCGGAPSCRSCPLRTAFTSVLQSGDAMHGIEWEAVILVENCETCFWFEVNVDPVPLAGDRHAVVCLNDITDRKRASLAIEGLNHQLAVRARELEAANRELETFAYSVSHDLRAPLRAIDGFSRILLRDCAAAVGERGRENLEHVRAASQRMGRLIDDMLQLSRTSRAEVRRVTVNLSQLAETIVAEFRQADPARHVVCTVAPDITAHADPTLMRAVLENLLGNAWKFTGRIPEGRIEFGTTAGREGLVFFVRDNGAGFDMRYADRLFGPFQRLHTEAEFPGTGIGLATTQRIVHRHGGRLWAEGRVGEGATFSFTLPASPPAP